jgi:ribulose-phosphate 3-epimerase
MFEIIPGILEKNWEEIERKINTLSPFAKTLHIDIADGIAINNTTFLDPKPFARYKDQFLLEVHMMVKEPINYLLPFADAGFKRFIGQVEKMSNQEEFVAQGQLLGEIGLALDGPTGLEAITVPYEDLDVVLLYVSEKMGFSGPPMLPERLEKVKALSSKTGIPIEVDGGIKDTTIELAKQSGATRFVATSFISGATDPKTAYEKLVSIVSEN